MTRKTLGQVALLAVFCTAGYTGTATGQGWYAPPAGSAPPANFGSPGNICSCSTPVAQVSTAICQPPVTHVAVTEVHQCKQTVHRPVVEQQLVDQQVTEYHPVCETQTANVPTVNYAQVTECQTRTRDLGQWVTNYSCRPQMSPCEYDPRPGLGGWLNRTGYSMRMAFTPTVVAERSYVPNVVTESVPVTRTVAIPATKQVSYQVTRMVPVTTNRKVAVNTVKMVAQEVVTNHNVTVMRPVGSVSTMALAPSSVGTAQLQPIPNASLPQTSQLTSPRSIPSRQATRPTVPAEDDAFNKERSDDSEEPRQGAAPKGNRTGMSYPASRSYETTPAAEVSKPAALTRAGSFGSAPSAVRASQWVATRRAAPQAGPALSTPDISVADSSKSLRSN